MVFSGLNRVMFAVPVDHSQGGVVRQTVRQLLKAAEFPDEIAGDVILALGEAFANAVTHGTGSRCQQVDVFVRADRCHVAIELRYPGEPFETRTPGAPVLDELTGRGLYLMTALMDSVIHTFEPGETVVRLEKNIRPPWDDYQFP